MVVLRLLPVTSFLTAMVFVYDYHPRAETLMCRHFSMPNHTHLNGYNNPYNLDGAARPYSAGKGSMCSMCMPFILLQMIIDIIVMIQILVCVCCYYLACAYFVHVLCITGGGPRQQANLLSESVIWSYIVQLSSALRTIHALGLAARIMDPTKILLTDKSRLVPSLLSHLLINHEIHGLD